MLMRIPTRTYPSKPTSQPQLWSLHRRLLLSMILTLAVLPCLAFSSSTRTYAATPTITWDQTMIYPGQNNGNPWGPPGEHVLVHGTNFQADQQVALTLVEGDSNTSPIVCAINPVPVIQATVTNTGSFEAQFIWPGQVNKPGQAYSICSQSVNAGEPVVLSRLDSPGPFTILTTNSPAIDVTQTSVKAGANINVEAMNWVPNQPINVEIVPTSGSGFISRTQVTPGNATPGKFSTTLAIPANTATGNYEVTASTVQNNLLSTSYTHTNRPLSIAGTAVTSTPTVTTTPTPVATPTVSVASTPAETPVATTTATAGGGGSNGTTLPGNTNKSLIFVLLIALAALILAIGVLLIFIVALRKGPTAPLPNTVSPGSGLYDPYGQPGQSAAGYPQPALCARCGRPLPPNSLLCPACGFHNGLVLDPNGPTAMF